MHRMVALGKRRGTEREFESETGFSLEFHDCSAPIFGLIHHACSADKPLCDKARIS